MQVVWGTNWKNWRHVCNQWSQWDYNNAVRELLTGTLSCLGDAHQEGPVVKLPSMRDNTWNAFSSVLGWMSDLRAYGLRQKGRLAQVTLLWMFATGHLIRTRKWIKPSRGSLKGTGPASCGGLNYPEMCWRCNTVKR